VKRTRRYCLFALTLCFATMASLSARAQSISIQVNQTLAFPTLATPSGGGVNLSIDPKNSSTSGTAQIISGTALRGQYALSYTPGGSHTTMSVDISTDSTGNPNLTLDNFNGVYNSQVISSFPSPLDLPSSSPSSTPLYLGARVTASPPLPSGSYNATFTITISVL
jgi:hypothetical protein